MRASAVGCSVVTAPCSRSRVTDQTHWYLTQLFEAVLCTYCRWRVFNSSAISVGRFESAELDSKAGMCTCLQLLLPSFTILPSRGNQAQIVSCPYEYVMEPVP